MVKGIKAVARREVQVKVRLETFGRVAAFEFR